MKFKTDQKVFVRNRKDGNNYKKAYFIKEIGIKGFVYHLVRFDKKDYAINNIAMFEECEKYEETYSVTDLRQKLKSGQWVLFRNGGIGYITLGKKYSSVPELIVVVKETNFKFSVKNDYNEKLHFRDTKNNNEHFFDITHIFYSERGIKNFLESGKIYTIEKDFEEEKILKKTAEEMKNFAKANGFWR